MADRKEGDGVLFLQGEVRVRQCLIKKRKSYYDDDDHDRAYQSMSGLSSLSTLDQPEVRM